MNNHAHHSRTARWLFWAAAVAGIAHAIPSIYWALGGTVWLETVGRWAVEQMAERRGMASATLGAAALVKVAGALIPLAVAYGLVPGARVWRALSWVGGIGLIGYGALHVVTGALVLSGVIRPDGGYDHDGIFGHAVIWGPLFLVWGLLLTAALWVSRPPAPRHDAAPTRT